MTSVVREPVRGTAPGSARLAVVSVRGHAGLLRCGHRPRCSAQGRSCHLHGVTVAWLSTRACDLELLEEAPSRPREGWG